MARYRVDLIYTDYPNYEYYKKYNRVVFYAKNDLEAIQKVEMWQDDCEEKQIFDGVGLNDYDPCLLNHINKYVDNEWIRVEY